MDMIQDIDDFHKKFGFTKRELGAKPDVALLQFRLKFLMEELHEMKVDACKDDLEGILDAIVDLIYVALGTGWLLNLDVASAWKMVHEANMAKVRAEHASESKRGSTFDVVKPKGWKKPNVDSLIDPLDRILKHTLPKQAKQTQLDLVEYLKTLEQGEQP
jgi:predicted HAD superfamily Cof-like phosphohydrolase